MAIDILHNLHALHEKLDAFLHETFQYWQNQVKH